jgi:hypothetical protein
MANRNHALVDPHALQTDTREVELNAGAAAALTHGPKQVPMVRWSNSNNHSRMFNKKEINHMTTTMMMTK